MKVDRVSLVIGFVMCVTIPTALAQDTVEDSRWSGNAELGAVFTTGNTEEEQTKFRTEVVRDGPNWRHTFHLDGLRSSRDGDLTAQRFYSSYQADRKRGNNAIFGRISWEDDQFSGFDYQVNISGGYSKELFRSDVLTLNGDAGVGARISALNDAGTQANNNTADSEVIVRLAGDLRWQVSETASFRQKVSTEIGSESTVSRAETSLTTDIVGSLAVKLALTVRHQTTVPMDKENLDTETSVTIVYQF